MRAPHLLSLAPLFGSLYVSTVDSGAEFFFIARCANFFSRLNFDIYV
jgi:hypothetical protein